MTSEGESSSNVNYGSNRKYVDIGLPSRTLWAACNIGADSPSDYGLYFAWGDTNGYTQSNPQWDRRLQGFK